MGVLEDLKSTLAVGARGNKYRVTMAIPSGTTQGTAIDILCKGASIPGKTIGVIPIFSQGRELQVAGDVAYEKSWSLTFWATQGHELRLDIENWMEAIDSFVENARTAASYTDYMISAQVAQLDTTSGEATAEYTFHNMFPTSVAAMDYGDDANDAILEFGVDFSYSHWVRAN